MTTTETITTEEIVAELRAMVEHTRDNPGIMQRAFNTSLSVMYEFIVKDQIEPYYFTLNAKQAVLEAGRLAPDACDVIIRMTPQSLHEVLNGTLGGREAVQSGRMEIVKAPAMPKLLMMRGMFNRYRKSLQGIKVERNAIEAEPEVNVKKDSVITLTPHSGKQ